MLSQEDLDSELKQFLSSHVHSGDELAALLLLARPPHSARTVESAARELSMPIGRCRTALLTLADRGLLAADRLGSSFCYAPRQRLRRRIDELVRLYDESPVVVLRLINANAIERMRTATRAFSETLRPRATHRPK